jgi:hypothetical protein
MGKPKLLKQLAETMVENLLKGHFSTYACDCDPKCQPLTQAEEDLLGEAIVRQALKLQETTEGEQHGKLGESQEGS